VYKIKLSWRILVGFLLILGIVGFAPVSFASYQFLLSYNALLPAEPVFSIVLWILALVFYRVGLRKAADSVKGK